MQPDFDCFKIRIYRNIYSGVMRILNGTIRIACKYINHKKPSKAGLFIIGQQGLLNRIEADMRQKRVGPTYWFHAASLGEYAVARPIISALKQKQACTVVVTFFSSTGYEALKEYHPGVDYLYYLPLDTPKNAKAFLEAVHPDKAVFMISEYWCNYLFELKKRDIPTYLISAMIRKDAVFFKWYGKLYRKALAAYTHFMVLDETSRQHLHALGFGQVTVTGDPLFDNAIVIAGKEWTNPIVERFCGEEDIFIAGSISDEKDLSLVSSLANHHRDTRFIFVPHEITTEGLRRIKYKLRGYALCYSECDEKTDFSDTQVLIIDFLGALAYLYRYARWAYIGGGFTPYLHSVIEATVYGVPVSFGPQIHRKVTPLQLMELGIGQMVKTQSDLNSWFESLRNDTSGMQNIRSVAAEYVKGNAGATEKIVNRIIRA